MVGSPFGLPTIVTGLLRAATDPIGLVPAVNVPVPFAQPVSID